MSECPPYRCLANDELWKAGRSPFRCNESHPDGRLYILVELNIHDSEVTFEYINPEDKIKNTAKLGVFAEHSEQLRIPEFNCEDWRLADSR